MPRRKIIQVREGYGGEKVKLCPHIELDAAEVLYDDAPEYVVCGKEDELYVIRCSVQGEMHIDRSGFYPCKGKTQKEVVKCYECGYVFDLQEAL